MRVLFVSSEVYPLAKTGGLADVSSALPITLSGLGVDIRVLLPGYPQALDSVVGKRVEADLGQMFGTEHARLISGWLPDADVPVWLIDAPQLYRRDGGLYQDPDGSEWPDNPLRFAALSHAGARLGLGGAETMWRPDIVHANDWHTGLLPLILASSGKTRPATVFTIHNMAFQGNFAADCLAQLDIPAWSFCPEGLEFHGRISFLKAGIFYSDRLTTVSPTYSKEIVTPEYGFGLDGLLRTRGDDLIGILNGVDCEVWDPVRDVHLPNPYGVRKFSGKKICKVRLQEELGLPSAPETPLIAFLSRLTRQKMADVVLEILPSLCAREAQFVLHGKGDRDLENAFHDVARAFPQQIAVRIGYDEPLAHRVQAGADMLLAPSRFEPCGLSQLYALRYGTLPIVRRTGGLNDTVVNCDSRSIKDKSATGFVFDDASAADMVAGIQRAISVYRQPLTWRRIQIQAMKQDFSWTASAKQYLSLYRSLTGDVGRTDLEEDRDIVSDVAI